VIQENLERSRWRRRCIKECATAVAQRKSLERSLMQRASGDAVRPGAVGWRIEDVAVMRHQIQVQAVSTLKLYLSIQH